MDSSCCPRDDGASHVEADAEGVLDRGLSRFNGEAVLQFQIDAIEPSTAAEHLLSGVNIHHGEVAAERAGQPARPHDAAHGERPVPHHRRQRDAVADPQSVSIGELLRDDDRIGLREKHQRVVDDGLVAALEIVVAQAAIAGHVDAENQQVALAREARRRRRLDDRHRDLHLWNRLHALEDLLREARLTGRHLKLRGTGNAIDRSLEREEDRLIRRVHRHEHGDAKHDSNHGQQGTDRVFLQIRPADESEQAHNLAEGGLTPCSVSLI